VIRSTVVQFGLVIETHYHVWWYGARAAIPKYNAAGGSAR
jgi:hypothetical protein